MSLIPNGFPSFNRSHQPQPLTEGHALELSLMAPLDAFQGFESVAGIPKRVISEGWITRTDDPTYKRSVFITREFDPTTGTYSNHSTLKGPDGELSVEEKTAWDMREGLSSKGNLTHPSGPSGDVRTKQSYLPLDEGGGVHTEGTLGDISFGRDERMEDLPEPEGGLTSAISHQDGYIFGPDRQGVKFYRQLTSDLASGITTIAGKFGSLEETGLITLNSAPNSVDVKREVGPYRIRQTIIVEQHSP